MLGFLKDHPYVFALATALLTATLLWLYTRTTEKDPDAVRKTFYKTLLVGVVAGFALTWLAHRREPVCSQPFPAE